jgi:outer membrane protein insertion porin family
MKDGEIFNADMVRKGIEDLRKVYGALGYINFTSVPDTSIDEEHKLITLKIDIDEGKQFYVRRIEFQGNTTTRDKVIRRELAVEEGHLYNSQLWDLSLQRLNQLSYFEPLKPEQASEVHQNVADNSVDITLKLKEKGKNSIGLTGGVSGLSGTFIGLNFTTNNFLGLGETLQIGGTIGQYERNVMFGFTEPYLFDRPLQTGFTVYARRYDYNQAKQASLASGTNLNLPLSVSNSLQNYSQASTGATVSLSYPIKRSFKRVGITYGFDVSSISTFTTASQLYFEDVTFRNLSGPNALSGIKTSKVTPNFTYNHIDYPARPHNGKSFFIGTDISGLGGNVKAIRPIAEYKQFIPMKGLMPKYGHPAEGRQTFGFRIQASHISGYGGLGASPFERFFLGGDTDLRGFDVRAVSPVALYLASAQSITLQNPDGSTVPLDPNNPRRGNTIVQAPIYQLVFPGGDTSLISNMEYRVPIVGPVTMAAFVDTGWNMVLQPSQLRLSSSVLNDPTTGLNNMTYGCALVTPAYVCQGKTLAQLGFSPVGGDLRLAAGTNGIMRMSTGLELQVILPVVNAPFRIYYAVNPMRMNTTVYPQQQTLTRSMFPPGGAGDYTYQQAVATYGMGYHLHEPFSTFRFTVATTF